jgi:hypothetical protein
MRLRVRLGIALAVLLLVAGSAFAQGTLGRLAGSVLDSSGGVLPGATVRITNTQTNQIQSAVTNESGGFVFPGLSVGTYKVTIEMSGFKTANYSNVQINVNQEYSLTARLEVGGMTESMEVTATSPLVRTTTPEVSKTIDQTQVLALPIVNRDMTNLIRIQAGVPGTVNRVNTGINGGRATWTQVTQDGINIQDNFIRTNSLDFLPNRPTSDNVSEFTITSSVQGADAAGGATAIRMVTPSGSNQFRGSAWWQNRDNKLAANSFFNNKSGVPKAKLEQNQFGGRLSGPVMKDKVFFWGSYEGFRRTQAGAQNQTIAANPDLFQGVWRYVRADGGGVGALNMLQAVGSTLDTKLQTDLFSKIPASSNVNNYDRGDSRADRVLNTAAYRWDQSRQTTRNYFSGRVDFEASANHHFELVGTYFKEVDDRPDLDFISGPGERPLTFTESPVKRFAGAWRWQVSPRLQNELRGGANLAPVGFGVVEGANPTTVRFAGQTANLPLTLMDPEINFFPQGRYTNTYQINDNASLTWKNHAFRMGASYSRIHVNPYNYEGTVPTITWGFSSAAPASAQLTSAMFPGGISAAELASANTMLSMLTGTISAVTRTFQVQDQTSGYVPGIPNNRNYTLNNVASYIQDNWRLKSNFTVTAGLKWEYYSPVSEDDNLGFLPVANGKSYDQVLRDPNATITFINGGMWKPDRNNFGPTIGFGWDVFKDGKTGVTGGYSLTYVNEEGVTVATNSLGANAGLATGATLSSQYAKYGAGVPLIPTPTFKTTRTLADQMALSATAPMGMPDPNLQQPRVHQVSVGIARELSKSFAGEVRYVGSWGRGIWRGIDTNQIQVSQTFVDDFNRARSNGYLAQQAGLAFSPVYNPAVPGSQQLTVLPKYGLLTNSSVRTFIQQNESAGLADFYVTQRVAGSLADFYPNPGIYEGRAVINDGWQNYNALQVELRRQYRGGVFGAINYTLSKTTSSGTGGTSQSRFEPYLDNARPQLDSGRSLYNTTHIINANFIVDLPFGEGRHWMNKGGVTDAVLGGWQLSGIVNWQSGAPISILSGRGSFNRANRSTTGNTAVTALSPDEIKKLFGVFKTPNGNIYWIDPKVIGPDGRAVGADNLNNSAGFDGQIFFNPTANGVGSLPIYAFDGPSILNINAALSKRFKLAGRTSLELRGEAFNLFNSAPFFSGDMNVNSTTFGRLTSTAIGSRVIQLTARVDF